jgi:phage terminase small subunit
MRSEVRASSALDNLCLNDMQRSFVEHFVRTKHGTKSAIAAGYSEATAKSAASRLLKHPGVMEAIAEMQEAALNAIRERHGITLESTLVGIGRVANADPRKLFDENGAPKAIHDLDDDTALAIESVEVVEQYEGSGEDRMFTGYVKKYRFARRSAAQDMLMKHLNGYKEHEKGKGEAAGNAVAALLESLAQRRSMLPIAHEVGDDHGV